MLPFLNKLRSDEALMQAYQHGDTDAFERLYLRHKDGLFAFLYRSCSQQALVEELAQEAWIAVVDAAANYQPTASFKTWLYRIGRNKLADHWRREQSRKEAEDVPMELESNDNNDDLEQTLMRAIGELPGEQRDALLLQQQGFSLSDIAQITDAAEETVKSRLRYARNQLREQLGGDT
jgi:RNA polymerase sigma-70 factor (ECF subfamily)